jgi:demethylmenaquinone methyltransferase / 2-methoxy-6-polyprenyl-1,4-benzoquinol methylase
MKSKISMLLLIRIDLMERNFAKGPDREKIKKMFNSIAGNYDLLNSILSMGVDNSWRRKGLSLFSEENKGLLLDLGAGTGDLSRMSFKYGFKKVVGADFSIGMLLKGAGKNARYPEISLCSSDAEKLPFRSSVFDACCIAFAIRNFQNRDTALREISRVLREKGELMIIEFSLPDNFLLKAVYKFYFFKILPFIGGLISGNFKAYSYLPESVSRFPDVETFRQMILDCGFSRVETRRLSLGIAYIYFAVK